MYHAQPEISRSSRGTHSIIRKRPYNGHMMSKSRLVPWLGFGAVLAGVAFLWHGSSRSPTDKAPPPADDAAGHGGRGRRPDPPDRRFPGRRLARDAGEQRLHRDPDQRLLREGSPLPHGLHDRRRGGRGEGQAVPRSQRRERRLRIVREHPARRGIAGRTGGGEPRVRLDGGRVPGGARADGAFPNDACYKYQWHMRQLGMPDAWKRGNGKGVVVAVIDTGVTKVGDLAETKFVPGYNFIVEQRQRRRRPRARHARRGHHRPVDQQQARRRGRRLWRRHHADQGAERARLGLGRRHHAGASAGRPTTAPTSST